MGSIFDRVNNHQAGDDEVVEGIFQCQEEGCWDIVEKVSYSPSNRRLSWLCEDGHRNTVEDFDIG